MANEREMKRKLLGSEFTTSGSKLERPTDKIFLASLMRPSEFEDTIIKMFCERCNMVYQLNHEMLNENCKMNGIPYPNTTRGVYINVEQCESCSDVLGEMKFLPIPWN